MGCSFELGLVLNDAVQAEKLLDEGVAEIQRIEGLLSEFKEDSAIGKINANAGIEEIEVNSEVMELLKRAIQISHLAKGYFDITMGPLKQLYQFKNKAFELPKESDIKPMLEMVGFQNLQLNEDQHTAYLRKKGMRISLAAIGKGYAADKVRDKWRSAGIQNGYIDASGDLTAFGQDENGNDWRIGIANPNNRKQSLFYIPLNNAAVATSGDYEQHFVHKGKRYSHTVNPKTGLPVTGIKSVSIFSPSAELSDALATAVYTMGIPKGVTFLNQLPQTHGILIDDENKVTFTKQLQYEAIPV